MPVNRIRFVWPCGVTFNEMQENVRNSPLYRSGDAILVWVNAGDFWMNSPRDLTAASVSDGSPEGVETEGFDPKDESAAALAETPSSSPQV